MNSEQITRLIEDGMPAAKVVVKSADDTHFEAVVVSPEFAGKSRLQRHQMVYAALGGRMAGEIHALSMSTLTPDEWRSGNE